MSGNRKYRLAWGALIALMLAYALSCALALAGTHTPMSGSEFVAGLGLVTSIYGAGNVLTRKITGNAAPEDGK